MVLGIKVALFNVHGLNDCIKRRRISLSVAKLEADDVFLQETHMKSADVSPLKFSRYQKQLLAPSTSKLRGVAILLANSLRFDCSKLEADPLGRYIFIKGVLEGQMYTIGSI